MVAGVSRVLAEVMTDDVDTDTKTNDTGTANANDFISFTLKRCCAADSLTYAVPELCLI